MAKAQFLGTYSTREPLAAGPGGKSGSGQRKQYWFIWQDTIANTYLAQPLNSSYDPAGKPRLLPPDTFRQNFSREPRVTLIPEIQPDVADYLDKAFSPGKKMDRTTVGGAGDMPAPQSSAPGTPPEEVDRELRAEFAKNIMRYRRGNTTGAVDEFKRLSTISDGIIAAHKHMFTDFGTDLRKSKLHDVAMSHFKRAAELAPDDSHAQFNFGRILFELGNYKEAVVHLEKALSLEPSLTYASKLLERIRLQMDLFVPEEF